MSYKQTLIFFLKLLFDFNSIEGMWLNIVYSIQVC